MSDPQLETVYGQPSWRIASNKVEAWLTRTGGHLGPITFDLGGRKIQPYNVAPWHNEGLDDDQPPVIKALRGDFFCMPFGANATQYEGERHQIHGEVCNGEWRVRSPAKPGRHEVGPGEDGENGAVDGLRADREVRLTATMDLTVRPGRVEKTVILKPDQTVVYQSHRISGLAGPMTFGHHAMLKFPDREGAGLVSTSPFVYGATNPVPVELPENRGYSMLAVDRQFERLDRVPTIAGGEADLTRYPARKGFEDLVMIVSQPRQDFAWSAVSFPDDGYVWFALKNPSVLRNTAFWLSNRGRYYPPWSGRHECVLGIEEVTSYFAFGLAESAAPNPMSDKGYPTVRHFDPDEVVDVRYVMGVVAIPDRFGRVASVEPEGSDGVTIRDGAGLSVSASVEWEFVRT